MTNRKSHTPFRFVPKSTTLDDLERPIRIMLQKRCVFRRPPQCRGYCMPAVLLWPFINSYRPRLSFCLNEHMVYKITSLYWNGMQGNILKCHSFKHCNWQVKFKFHGPILLGAFVPIAPGKSELSQFPTHLQSFFRCRPNRHVSVTRGIYRVASRNLRFSVAKFLEPYAT